MKRSLRRALWVGAVMAVTVATVPMASAFGAGSVTATFAKVQDWGTGHETRVTVTNGTDASVSTWRIEFDLPSGTSISTFWDADVTRTGDHYVAVKKSWAGPLAPGATFSWGYNGTGGYKAPLNCTVNGAPCGGGSTPPTTTFDTCVQERSPNFALSQIWAGFSKDSENEDPKDRERSRFRNAVALVFSR